MFDPRLALSSLSGESDAEWAEHGAEWAGAAFLGGVCLDEPTREAAREMVADRDRSEFLPDDPIAFVQDQLSALDGVDVRPGINVRSTATDPVREVAEVAAEHDAVLELNAHCRQDELCAVGAGETLLREPDRLVDLVGAAASSDADVSVKVRTELDGVDLVGVARRVEAAGADALHVDAMDSESVVAEVADATDLFLVANNGVRGRESVREYLDYGADAVSVGRPSDDPDVLRRVAAAVDEWGAEQEAESVGVEP
ncbi:MULTISPECIES: tRNA-dihydrouridine synthase [Halolamina]|uniref:TIM-barrel protein, putative n=1 Tax=Halolamina pelagica TaxID=699431 RepID=A0A1I5V4N2_9EURY|nr:MULTISPECIES: tRNA-dihydrouridine synthase [Halolamina]NHX37895.1 dihydropyrimidine dehydrogenase [Halolamina sp. R1-12]SFQ02524.1 TIM-barrel protein, putative [Halolamina pelagica]